ncbi:hypothetical protein O0L34_g17760 [Tuta absoluta]|nr:hypothetical protein O0L34_g17760 [Tuta absoluta]
MYGVIPVFLFISHASTAQQWDASKTLTDNGHENQNGITYRRSNNGCTVCLAAQDCAPFNPLQCEYYMKTNDIFEKENETDVSTTQESELRSEIDSLVYNIVEEGKSVADEADCIPYVSQYTDCTKENICVGCKTCNCDKRGSWICSLESTCAPELVRIIADRRTLAAAKESINQDSSRRKRSLNHSIRSLEEADLEKDMYDNYNDKEKFSQCKTTSINEAPGATNTLLEDKPNQDEADITTQGHKKKDLIKLIVHALIHDTLPSIFEGNSLDFENNRVKRGIPKVDIKENLIYTTVKSILESTDFHTEDVNTPKNKITFEELTEWVNEVHPLLNAIGPNNTLEKNDSYDNSTSETIVIPRAPVRPNDIIMNATNPEYIAFEEVYSNIQVDNKTSVRRKPLLHLFDDKDINMYDDKYNEDPINTSTIESVSSDNIFDTNGPTTTTDQTNPSTNRDTLYLQQPTEIDLNFFDSVNEQVGPELNYTNANNKYIANAS